MVKRKLFILLLSLSIAMCCFGLIWAMVSVDVTNHFETGIVDISLTEYQRIGDSETLWVDSPIVLPGDTISKIPRIHNDGNDCYVRAKVTISAPEGEDADYLSGISIGGIGEQWYLADDGYYYYSNILPHGEDVDVFQWVKIADNLSNEQQGRLFYVDIDVDAIQSKNFAPDYSSATPWGSVEILLCEKEGMYDISQLKQSDTQSFQIVYQGDAQKLIKSHDDFFTNIPYLLPGDVYSDSVSISNTGAKDIKLYFRSEALDSSELLDKITLKITTDINGKEKVFYEGALRAEDLNESLVLGVIPKGEKGTFKFEISVPSELNNKYTILDSYVKWIFSTEEIQESSPETGDNSNIGLYVGMAGVSLFVLVIIVFFFPNKKRRDKHE